MIRTASLTSFCSVFFVACAAPSHGYDATRAHPTLALPSITQGGSGGWTTNVNGILGGRAVEDDAFWAPVEDQAVFGVEFDSRPQGSIIGIEAGFQFAGNGDEDESGVVDVDTTGGSGEIYVGPRITFDAGLFHPYFGGGVTGITATREVEVGSAETDDDDSSVGGYVHGGFYATLDIGLNIGVDVRGVFGTELTLFNTATDNDYVQAALIIGGTF